MINASTPDPSFSNATEAEATVEPVQTSETGHKPVRSSGAALKILLLCLLLVGLVGALLAWRMDRAQTLLELRLEQLALQNREQSETLKQVRGGVELQQEEFRKTVDAQLTEANQRLLGQMDDQASEVQGELERLRQQLQAQQQKLEDLSANRREDQLLLEAEYLLKVANQRLLLERSAANALALIAAADALLAEVAAGLGDPDLFAVRKNLAEAVAALKLVEPVDREGIYLQLNALAHSLDELPRVPEHSFTHTPPPKSVRQPEITDDWWRRLWVEIKAMAGMLNDYIKIEDVNAPAQPLVDQYTSQLATLNLRLLIEQAQVALLKEQALIYRQSLEQAETLMNEYFIPSPAADKVKQSLHELAQLDIAPSLPDISIALQQLHDYVREQRRSAAAGASL